MKKTLLLSYGAFQGQVFPIAKALEKYFDVTCFHIKGVVEKETPFEYDVPEVKQVGADVDPDAYDIHFGFDGGCCDFLDGVLQHTKEKKIVGCNLLDIPEHVCVPGNRNYHGFLAAQWQRWGQALTQYDFVTSWKRIDIERIKNSVKASCVLFHPVQAIDFPNESLPIQPKLVYSGIIRPDKGVHLILEAISIANTGLEFVAVGAGEDLSDYAKWLKVKYTSGRYSNDEKFRQYHEALATITFSDNPYITPQSYMEGLSIGKQTIAAAWPETRFQGNDYGLWAEPLNVKHLASVIKYVSDYPPVYRKEAREFCAKYRSNQRWADEFYDFLMKESLV